MRERINSVDPMQGVMAIAEGTVGIGTFIETINVLNKDSTTFEILYKSRSLVYEAIKLLSDAGISPIIGASTIAALSSIAIADAYRRISKQ